MTPNDKQVYISYAWGGESERLVNELDTDLQASGIQLIRDKRDLGFKGMIRDFMQQIGRGTAVIVVISDKYLKSPNCMYELVEIAHNRDIYDRIFPIVLADADIYNPVNRIKYIRHWEDKIRELDEAIKTVSSANLQGIREEMDSYDEIRDNISNLTFLLKDMNTLTPEMHENSNFAIMISALKKRLSEQNTEPAEAAQVQVKKAPKATKTPGAAKAGARGEYEAKVLKKLSRDEYAELPDERFGDLRFTHVLEKNVKYLFNTLDEFHRFAIVEESDLSEDRYLELEKDVKQYSKKLGDQRSAFVHTLCLVLTERVSDELKELIYNTKPAKYGFTEMGSNTIVVYAAEANDIIYPKVITESNESKYSEKIQEYLAP